MKYLIQTVETYRADTEGEAQNIIGEAKESNEYALSKYTNEKKEVKSKGEIVDEYFKVTLTKIFTSIKEPETITNIIYEVE